MYNLDTTHLRLARFKYHIVLLGDTYAVVMHAKTLNPKKTRDK